MGKSYEPTAALLILGDELREARLATGLTQTQLGEKLFCTHGLVSMVETALRGPTLDYVKRCDEFFDTGERFQRMWHRARAEDATARVADLSKAEEQATAIRSYNPVLVPGLLQTEGYMRHQFEERRYSGATADDVEALVQVRLQRQDVLKNMRYLVLLDESVLRRTMGGREIAFEHLEALLTHARSPRVNIQVLRFDTPAYPAAGPMSIFDLSDGGQAVHLDGPVSGTTTANTDIVTGCVERFEVLRSQAASVPESVRMIQDRIEELRR